MNEKRSIVSILTDMRGYLLTLLVGGFAWGGVFPTLVGIVNKDYLKLGNASNNFDWFNKVSYLYFLSPIFVYLFWRLARGIHRYYEAEDDRTPSTGFSLVVEKVLLRSKFERRKRQNSGWVHALNYLGVLILLLTINYIVGLDHHHLSDIEFGNTLVIGCFCLLTVPALVLLYLVKGFGKPKRTVKGFMLLCLILFAVFILAGLSRTYYVLSQKQIGEYKTKKYDVNLTGDTLNAVSIEKIGKSLFRLQKVASSFKGAKDRIGALSDKFIGKTYIMLSTDTLYNDWVISDSVQTRRFLKKIPRDSVQAKVSMDGYKIILAAYKKSHEKDEVKPKPPSIDSVYVNLIVDQDIDEACKRIKHLRTLLLKFEPNGSFCRQCNDPRFKDTTMVDTTKQIHIAVDSVSEALCRLRHIDNPNKARKMITLLGMLDNLAEAGDALQLQFDTLNQNYLPLLISTTCRKGFLILMVSILFLMVENFKVRVYQLNLSARDPLHADFVDETEGTQNILLIATMLILPIFFRINETNVSVEKPNWFLNYENAGILTNPPPATGKQGPIGPSPEDERLTIIIDRLKTINETLDKCCNKPPVKEEDYCEKPDQVRLRQQTQERISNPFSPYQPTR